MLTTSFTRATLLTRTYGEFMSYSFEAYEVSVSTQRDSRKIDVIIEANVDDILSAIDVDDAIEYYGADLLYKKLIDIGFGD